MPSGGTAEWRIMKRMKNQQITALLLALALALAGCAGSGTAAQSAAGSTTGAAAAAVENSDSVADVQEEDSEGQDQKTGIPFRADRFRSVRGRFF